MHEQLRSILVGTAGLSVAGVVAAWLTLARGGVAASPAQLRAAVRVAAVAVLLQAGHFVEEFVTGFHRQFPPILGLVPWSAGFFIAFNLFWIVVWACSVWGLAGRMRLALFPLWFLGLAGFVNGIVHPLLSARTGGYFPGLGTSPLVAVAGFLLLRHLVNITGGRSTPQHAA